MVYQSRSVIWLASLAWGAACSSPSRDLGSSRSAGAGGELEGAGSSGKGSLGGTDGSSAMAGRGGASNGGASVASGAGGELEAAGSGGGGAQNATAGAGGASSGVAGAGASSGVAGAGASSGASNGGTSSGGASTAGAGAGGGGAGAPNTNQFVGGPCVTSPTTAGVEVFARGSDHTLYRRAIAASDQGTWQSLVGVDGSKLDARSDLDCASSSTAVHVVGTGVNGEYFHAVGFGTAYNAFVRDFPSNS